MTKKPNTGASVIGTLAQAVPVAYIVITGTIPAWARWTLGAWLGLWLLMMIIEGTKAADQ